MNIKLLEYPTEKDWIEWRSIKGYEGVYEVSNDGRVRRIAGWSNKNNGYRHPTGELKQDCVKGYPQIALYKNGEKKRFKVHRLVASAFLPNPLNLPQVNHKDGNKGNNNVKNLEWVTQSQNMKHARDTGLCPNDTPRMRRARSEVGRKTQNILKVRPRKPVIVTAEKETMRFSSCKECAKTLGLSVASVSRLCRYEKVGSKVKGVFKYES